MPDGSNVGVNLEDQIAAVRREIAMRERAYPRFVERKQLTQAKADHELLAMHAVLRTLLDIAAERGGQIA